MSLNTYLAAPGLGLALAWLFALVTKSVRARSYLVDPVRPRPSDLAEPAARLSADREAGDVQGIGPNVTIRRRFRGDCT
jgi:hypothetical protein